MARFHFVHLMSAFISIGIVGASDCPVRDQTGSALAGATLEDKGFVSCIYPKAGTCTYFNGVFDSGSDGCPDELTGSRSVRARAVTGSVCPSADQNGGALQAETIGWVVTCDYPASSCTYNKDGSYHSGVTTMCPYAIGRLPGYRRYSPRRPPSPRAAASGVCPSVDQARGALLSEGTTSDGFIACNYETSSCTYFKNGGFDSGSSLCPSDIPDTTSSA